MQTKRMSLVEACTNSVSGVFVGFFANLWILPLFGWTVSPAAAITVSLIFTGLSIIRSYIVRRIFNRWRHK